MLIVFVSSNSELINTKKMKKNLLLSILLLGTFILNAQNKNATDLPYSYGFETDDLDGWTIINAGSGNNWEVAQSSSETPDPS